jgi:hypothetical protein
MPYMGQMSLNTVKIRITHFFGFVKVEKAALFVKRAALRGMKFN